MKKSYLIAASVAVALMAGCSQETKEHAKETVQSAAKDTAVVVEKVKEKSADLMAQAKAKAAEAVAKAKTTASEAMEKAKESAAKNATQVAEKAKEATAEAVEAAKAKTAEAAASVEKKATEAKKSLGGGDEAKGKALFAKCAGCHGADGKMKALGKSPAIAGQDAASIAEKLKAYKAGTRNAYGMGGVMQGQAAGLSDEDIQALADYISKLK
ncbi:c-type cytochrome [Nitratifractor salsuginis]|uniref:Cytochrome c class I n=1 Tax=Nitratifractor salsuginis (strain DSM 16511 / JCM 12458 / E9I37-1) TaxID=749222 RepID=E6X234_NITSE|nr:c-type cytochrome [Nitratifractor salsuginis]ADV47103.1 cytochrome c class I [Nitratifractor salsuginis DSM 16511]